MNKNLKKLSLIALLIASTVACKKSDDPAPSDSGVTTLQGDLTGTTNLTANTKYLLKGFVYVPNGSTINIEAGTIITGQVQAALIIEPGAKINAIGTAAKPIIFTSSAPAGSRARGNWGGLVLAGNAKVNTATPTSKPLCEGGIRTQYGNDVSADPSVDNDNSGTLKYVRSEYAGYAPIPGSELNGITYAGVGRGTTLDHVQSSYANDDGMEWFGGCVNGKYLINFAAIDDDFDTDCGFSGKIQFGLAMREQYISDQSGSKAFESDHDPNAGTNGPNTTCQFVNMTLIGPVVSMADAGNANKPSKFAATYIAGIHIRRNSSLSMHNSILMAWNNGLLIDSKTGTSGVTTANITSGSLKMHNNIVAGISKNCPNANSPTFGTDNHKYDAVSVINGFGDLTVVTDQTFADSVNLTWNDGTTTFSGPSNWFYHSAGNNNKYQSDFANLLNMNLKNAWTNMTFDFTMPSGSPAATGGNFSAVVDTDNFFDTTPTYIGAFGTTDWTTGWANFNPQITNY